MTPHGIRTRAAFSHEGAARILVHQLKYQGAARNASLLALAMTPLVPDGATAIVPLPRSMLRRMRYGVDPANELARALGRYAELPVVHVFAPPLWWPSHAGSGDRGVIRFRTIRPLPEGSVLVDDVVTTGRTIDSAARYEGSHIVAALLATASAKIISARDRHSDGH
jgi:predicted amidophosphoribosyltransferase